MAIGSTHGFSTPRVILLRRTNPPDEKHARLRQLAKHRGISVNKLIEELATVSLAEFDAETRFRTLAARGSAEEGLALLNKLDRAFESPD